MKDPEERPKQGRYGEEVQLEEQKQELLAIKPNDDNKIADSFENIVDESVTLITPQKTEQVVKAEDDIE